MTEATHLTFANATVHKIVPAFLYFIFRGLKNGTLLTLCDIVPAWKIYQQKTLSGTYR